jgi:hypothetical protein
MAEDVNTSIGWGGELWLHDGTALYELVEVVSMTPPSGEKERVEYTHLKSPGKRRQYKPGLVADSEASAVINYRPGSTTDTLLRSAYNIGDDRAIKMVFPEDGVEAYQVTFTGAVSNYSPGEVVADGIMQATVTFTVASADTWATYTG